MDITERRTHVPRFHMAQRCRQIMALVQWPVRIVGMGRFYRHPPLPPHQISFLKVSVLLWEGLQSSHPHTLHPRLDLHRANQASRVSGAKAGSPRGVSADGTPKGAIVILLSGRPDVSS